MEQPELKERITDLLKQSADSSNMTRIKETGRKIEYYTFKNIEYVAQDIVTFILKTIEESKK